MQLLHDFCCFCQFLKIYLPQVLKIEFMLLFLILLIFVLIVPENKREELWLYTGMSIPKVSKCSLSNSDQQALVKLDHLYRVTMYLLNCGKHLVLFFKFFSVLLPLPHTVIMMGPSISLPYFLNTRVGT